MNFSVAALIPPSPCNGSRMIAQVLSVTSAFTLSRSLYCANDTPGTSGSNGSRYASCPVTDTAPKLLPWKDSFIAMNSYRPVPFLYAYFLAAFKVPSTASPPLLVKKIRSIPVIRFRSSAAFPQAVL